MDRMAIIAKTQKRYEGKSGERGGWVATTPLLRERVMSCKMVYNLRLS